MPFLGRALGPVMVALLSAPAVLPAPAAARDQLPCSDNGDAVRMTKNRFGIGGAYTLPRSKARTLVVFAHGYRKPATVYWPDHLRRAARRGVIAVAMNYRGIGSAPTYRGWNARSGATDTIIAAEHFWRTCPSVQEIILVSVSMGGNIAGLALAEQPMRDERYSRHRMTLAHPAATQPLFDHWVSIEGAMNVTETYLEAAAVASVNTYGAEAKEDIEKEMGGTIAEVPDRYREATIVARADDVAASGVKSVTFVHGLEDGLVPYDQSREMAEALHAQDVPVDFFTVLGRGDGDDGTVLTGYVLGQTGMWTSPLAGHGSEEDPSHVVIKTGFERLWAIRAGAAVGPAREFVVDGTLGTVPSR